MRKNQQRVAKAEGRRQTCLQIALPRRASLFCNGRKAVYYKTGYLLRLAPNGRGAMLWILTHPLRALKGLDEARRVIRARARLVGNFVRKRTRRVPVRLEQGAD